MLGSLVSLNKDCSRKASNMYAMTGFGQYGPYAKMAGHDINYVAISGLLGFD